MRKTLKTAIDATVNAVMVWATKILEKKQHYKKKRTLRTEFWKTILDFNKNNVRPKVRCFIKNF